MPLSMADIGTDYTIMKLTGNDNIRHHLQSLGFTEGTRIIIVSRINGNLIVNVRETRIAISRQMANRILIE